MKNVLALTALGSACYLLSAFASPATYAQEGVKNAGREKLFTYRVKISRDNISGIGPSFNVAAGKVFEVNVSATCTYANPGDHTITVSFHDLANNGDHYMKSADSNGGQSASIITGPVVGFQTGTGSPAFDVVCGERAEIEVIALGRVIGAASQSDQDQQ